MLVWGAAGPAGAAGCCSGVWTVVETGLGARGLTEGTTAMTCRVLFFEIGTGEGLPSSSDE